MAASWKRSSPSTALALGVLSSITRRDGGKERMSADVTEERAEPKVVLLVRLLSAIDEGRFTFEQLKGEIGEEKAPSTRTLRRYLSVLSDAGFPWYFDRASGTYRFVEGYSLRRLNLSHRELLGLVTLKRLGNSLGGTFASAIEETTQKLLRSSDRRAEAAIESTSFAIRLESISLDSDVERIFEQLQTAERERRRVQFGYTDKNAVRTHRRVDPYGFIVSSGRIYLVGFDHTRADMRVFAVDNVSEVAITPQGFERPADFNLDAYGANSVSGVRHAEQLAEVTVRFSPVVAKAATLAQVARERTVAPRADGAVDVTYRVADPLEIVRWSLRWGTEAEVIAPEEARIAAARIARSIAERYATPARGTS
jgi:predicted DNA-binding transcriptional regulator YafY